MISKILRLYSPPVCFLFLGMGSAFAQPSQVQPSATRSIGRYMIHYHPSNFRQALLLDTATGTVWHLVHGTYKSTVEGEEEKEVEYRAFQKLGVEGLYKSPQEEIAEQQATDEMAKALLEKLKEQRRKEEEHEKERLRKLKETEPREKRLEKLSRAVLPSAEELRNMASRSNGKLDRFLNILYQDWPGYSEFIAEFTFYELFQEIRNRYPKLAEDFRSIFAGVETFRLPE